MKKLTFISSTQIKNKIIMKKFILSLALIFIVAVPVFSQSQSEIKLEDLENNRVIKTGEIVIGDRFILLEKTDDKTNVSITRKDSYRNRASRFRGHLSGIGIGYNGFLTDFWSTSLNPDEEYFSINLAKSIAWNFTFPSVSAGITRHFGFVSAIGLTLNDYRFDNNNSIIKGEQGVISPLYPAEGIVYKKSKLHTAYANIPFVLELQIPANGNHYKTLNISGGVIGAVKLWSRTKTVWHDGSKHKQKKNDSFNLNMLRWGATARAGYGSFQVYGTTYFTPLFEKGKGPELYPFEIGVMLNF